MRAGCLSPAAVHYARGYAELLREHVTFVAEFEPRLGTPPDFPIDVRVLLGVARVDMNQRVETSPASYPVVSSVRQAFEGRLLRLLNAALEASEPVPQLPSDPKTDDF